VFGDLVRDQRRRAGLTQEDLAVKAGVGVRTIRGIEAGRIAAPRPGTVVLLADALALAGADRQRFLEVAAGGSPGEPATAPDAWPRPAQLPPGVVGFAGREEVLAGLDALTTVDKGPPAVVISAIAGTAGIGKTALAVHWAHRAATGFPDGQLYVNLRGFDPSGSVVTPSQAVRGFLDAFGVPPARVPHDLAAQVGLYRSLVADRRMLVVLDNARDAEQVRPLLPGAPRCLVLVTSRNDMSGLVAIDGAQPFTLDVLTPEDAWELLARRLGRPRLDAEPEAVEEILVRCGRLPLALAVVAARAAGRPDLPLATVAAQLREAGLEAFAGPDAATDVRSVFGWSYRTLGAGAARLFRWLGLHSGPDISTPAAASLAGAPLATVRPWLAELTAAHLVTEPSAGRYIMHDLLHAYAAERAGAEDAEADRRAAVSRLFDHYLHSACAADAHLNPIRDPLVLPATAPDPGAIVEGFADADAARAWLNAEQRVLSAAVRHAADLGFDPMAWQLAWTLETVLGYGGDWNGLIDAWNTGLEAARRLGDLAAQGFAHRMLCHHYAVVDKHEDAERHIQTALDLYARADDPVAQGHIHRMMVLVRWRQGQPEKALEHAERALALYRAAEHPRGIASALNNVGWCLAELGRERAVDCCEESVLVYREVGDRDGEAHATDSLGYAHLKLGHPARAVEGFQRAIDLYRELGDDYYVGESLAHLGDAHEAAGDLDAARAAWKEALQHLTAHGHPEAAAVRAKLDELDQSPP